MKDLLDRLFDRETIGHPDCPLMLRWTFFNRLGFKAMVHYFPEGVEDKDPHDHPRSFLTILLRGAYLDVRWEKTPDSEYGQIQAETVTAPAIRFRPAEHMHIVETFPGTDCWTLVVMGPMKRAWGFLQLDGKKWWPWERYVSKFGGTVRCDTDDGDRTHELERSGKHPPGGPPAHVGHNSNHGPGKYDTEPEDPNWLIPGDDL